jgi:hypothetical protein
MVRLGAFHTLAEAGLSTALAGEFLILLETENELIYSLNRTGGPSVSDSLGEEWGEYYAEVRGACTRYCASSNPRMFAALADGAYNEDSPGMLELARTHGQAILGRLLGRSMSEERLARVQALRMLGVVAELNPQFSATEKASIRQSVLRAVEDKSYPIRAAGIRAMGTIGSPADVPLLQRIAATDENRVATKSGGTAFPLREEAARAIRRISERRTPPK